MKPAEVADGVFRMALPLGIHHIPSVNAYLFTGLEGASTGLRAWMPVMPSIGQPTAKVHGGEKFTAGGRTWEIMHTPGHSPGHICVWSADEQLLCSGDHLLKPISPPVTFERGFERDPMGSYLDSLRLIEELKPALVLPGHGEIFADGAGRAAEIAEGKRRRLGRVLGHRAIAAQLQPAVDDGRGAGPHGGR